VAVKTRGIIVPTALFVAMFVLLLCTVLFASVSHNLGLSLDSVETTEHRYLSFGAMNELLSDLNAGLDAQTYTRANPRRVETGGTLTECWVEPLTGKNVLVVAQTRRRGGRRPEAVKSLCTFQEFDTGRVYTNVIDDNPNSPDPICFSDLSAAGDWSQLPPAPRTRYTNSGTIETRPGESAGTLPFVAGAPDGSLYAIYAPALDGWGDQMSPALFGIPFPIAMPWGQLTRQTIVAGNRQGLTVGELAPVEQTLIDHLLDVTVSQGAVMLKYSQEQGQWSPLPPAEEARVVNGQVQVQTGNYHIQGVSGPPTAYDGGIVAPCFRNGPDTIYNYTNESGKWDVLKPPGPDVLLLSADVDDGTPFVQTGSLMPVNLLYFLRVLLGDLSDIHPQAVGTALHKYEKDQWVKIPDPPAEFFKKTSQELVERPYSGTRGATLGGMVASGGELTVVNRPPDGSNLVDTIYRYRQGRWEVVPPPPNKRIEPATGNEVTEPGLPSRVELGIGADGKLILRVPTLTGPNPIFMQTKGGAYDLLPPVKAGGALLPFLSQSSGGRKRDASNRGSYVVRATYF
jgi:hypothetical protein